MKNLRFLGKEQEMNLRYQVPLEERGNLKARQVQRGIEVTMALQPEEVPTVPRIADVAATTLHHPGGEDQEEMSLGLEGQGQTLQFLGVSHDLELQDILKIAEMTHATITKWTLYLTEQGTQTLTPLGQSMKGILSMMLRQHHQKPLLDLRKNLQGPAAVMRGTLPGPQPRQLLAKRVRQLIRKALPRGSSLRIQL